MADGGQPRHASMRGDRLGVRMRSRCLAAAIALGALAALGLPPAAHASLTGAASTPAAAPLPHAMGLLPAQPPAVSSAPFASPRAAAAALPASVDLTKYAMPVGNQGAVGSCGAWATGYSALGYWVNKQGLPGGALAPMYTYSQVDGGQDNGSSIEANLYLDEQQGIDDQSDYYQGSYDYADTPNSAELAHAVNWKLTGFSGLLLGPALTQQSIETALAGGDPVVLGIPVYDNFFYVTSANNGLYSGVSGTFAGDHAVTALGYNSTGVVIENSWGTGWGNAGYATLAWSYVKQYVFDAVAIGPLATGQPVGGGAPAVTGTAHQGTTLTASNGSWSPAASSYRYLWEHATAANNWVAISGATSSTYVPSATDVGDHLRVLVTATNGKGQGAAASASTPAVPAGAPASSAAPSVTGTLRTGQTLAASSGTWRPAPASYGYQWQRSTNAGASWSSIAGAIGSSYQLATADEQAQVRVVVTAVNPYGQASAASAATATIKPSPPANTTAPAVGGVAGLGATLTASPGVWTPGGSAFAYTWQRGTAARGYQAIAGTTGSTYKLQAADVGQTVRVVVTASNVDGSTSMTSAATPTVTQPASAK